MMKRISPAPMGRAYRIRKRSNHVTIIVAADKQAKKAAARTTKKITKPKADEKSKTEKVEKKAAKTPVKKETK
jgi:large subunit ribosomal protein L22